MTEVDQKADASSTEPSAGPADRHEPAGPSGQSGPGAGSTPGVTTSGALGATGVSRGPRVVDAPLAPPSPDTGLVGVFQRRYLLKLLVRREISARYQGSVLGLFWSYLNPLSQLFTFYVIMGKVVGLGSRLENFAVHVFCGLIIVHFFTETFGAGTRSIVRNKGLVQKMAVPREMFPVASMLVSLYHVVPEVIILTITCVLVGWHPDLAALFAGLLALGIVGLLGTSLALAFSAANVFFRDVGSFVSILSNFIRFSVPMIYPYDLVATRFGNHQSAYLLNPIADAVLLMNRAFWLGTTSHPKQELRTEFPAHLFARGIGALLLAAVCVVIAQTVFRRLENRIPERLS